MIIDTSSPDNTALYGRALAAAYIVVPALEYEADRELSNPIFIRVGIKAEPRLRHPSISD
jgi:hypothetical protein